MNTQNKNESMWVEVYIYPSILCSFSRNWVDYGGVYQTVTDETTFWVFDTSPRLKNATKSRPRPIPRLKICPSRDQVWDEYHKIVPRTRLIPIFHLIRHLLEVTKKYFSLWIETETETETQNPSKPRPSPNPRPLGLTRLDTNRESRQCLPHNMLRWLCPVEEVLTFKSFEQSHEQRSSFIFDTAPRGFIIAMNDDTFPPLYIRRMGRKVAGKVWYKILVVCYHRIKTKSLISCYFTLAIFL